MGAQAAWGFRGSRGSWLNCWAQETKGLGDDGEERLRAGPQHTTACAGPRPLHEASQKKKDRLRLNATT